MNINDKVTITDEENNEFEGTVIATYDMDGKDYVLVDVEEMEEQIAFWIDENGELISIETDEEFDKAEDILNSLD